MNSVSGILDSMTLHMKILLGITAIAVVIALGTFGFMRSRMQPRFPYLGQPLPDADYRAMAARPGWRAHQIKVAPGIELRGLLREPATPAGPWVIFFNGNSEHMLAEGQRMLDALCAERGWGGVVWAYRSYDSSGGKPDPARLSDDGFVAYSALLKENHLAPDAVHLVGFSLGTSVATAVAARARQNPPASLTLLAPMTILYMGDRTDLLLHRYETLKWLDEIASPVLIVHGKLDATLKVEGGRTVAETLGSRAQLLELPQLGHYELPMSEGAQNAVRAFISEHQAGKQPAGSAAPL
jgi:uncharacterized protein